MDTAAPLAPTPADAPAPTVSATIDAANRGDFSAFDKAALSARDGKPLPDVTVEPSDDAPPVAGAPPSRPVSRRQQAANDAVSRAVELATADLRAENARLKAIATPETRREPEAPKAPPAAETPAQRAKRYAALPDAPRLGDTNPDGTPVYDTLEEFHAAQSLFLREVEGREAQAATHASLRDKGLRTQAQSFGEKLQAAKAADPDLPTKIAPQLLTAVPLSGLPKTAEVSFANIVAEAAFRSPNPADLYVYLSDAANAAEVNALSDLSSVDEVLLALARVDGRLAGRAPIPAAAADDADAAPSPISAAPPPAPTLSRPGHVNDPKAAAITRGDFATFDKLEQAEVRAKRGRA